MAREYEADVVAAASDRGTRLGAIDGAAFAERFRRNADLLNSAAHVDTMEHDACGVGLIATIDGKPRREVVLKGVEALKAVWHRGAVDADGGGLAGAGLADDHIYTGA